MAHDQIAGGTKLQAEGTLDRAVRRIRDSANGRDRRLREGERPGL